MGIIKFTFSFNSIIYQLYDSTGGLQMAKKVLVADDSVVIQKSIGISFAQEDFDVTFVGNGDEAFQKAKEIKPDIILADTSMPKLSGTDLCKKFRQDPEFRRTPIILLSNSQENFTPAQLKACGANDFVQKPFESAQLLGKIKPLLEQAQFTAPPEMAREMPKEEPATQELPDMFGPEDTIKIDISKRELAPEKTLESEAPPRNHAVHVPAASMDTQASLDVLGMDMDLDEDDQVDSIPVENFEPPTKIYTKPTVQESDLRPETKEATRSAHVESAAPTQLNLTDKQIEQIVSKVFETVIERIAWEVVPELAERMIREELAKITSDE